MAFLTFRYAFAAPIDLHEFLKVGLRSFSQSLLREIAHSAYIGILDSGKRILDPERAVLAVIHSTQERPLTFHP
jgi:hypothetical protein